jgi:hypothetical protein
MVLVACFQDNGTWMERGMGMPDQQAQSEESEQDSRRDRRVKWAVVFATTIDAASKIAEIIFRR